MLKDLYIKKFGVAPESVIQLTQAGSNRRYFRLRGVETVVGVAGTSVEENEAFIYLSRHFYSRGLNVPRVIAVSADGLCYLQTDLGDMSLFDRRTDTTLLEKAVSALPDFQYSGAVGLDFSRCYPVSDFDAQSILWDLNYFKYCFLNTTGTPYLEANLEADFRKMAATLSVNPAGTFMYRDFQSRNVMIVGNEPFFIDFQGGRRGPAEYDLVSFITQARAGFSEELRSRLIDVYIASASKYTDIDRPAFMKRLRDFSLLRNLQVLGAYGFRGKFERKPHFLKSIPLALNNLHTLLREPSGDYPYLISVLNAMLEKLAPTAVEPKTESSLTVTVMSFSYKKGIPADMSGNGGGFVFDCRGMENPGRYEEYKKITGLDRPVIDFLESKGEIITFLEHCYGLVDPSVDCYDRRGFTSLSVNFGCTGGQHRSVYSAQKMAEHIKATFPHVKVHLIHREQNIDTFL